MIVLPMSSAALETVLVSQAEVGRRRDGHRLVQPPEVTELLFESPL